jgi:hypothetical protein
MWPKDEAVVQRLRELGMGMMSRQGVVEADAPHCQVEWVEYEEDGKRFGRRTLKTPVGEVYSVHQLGAAYGSSWFVNHFIKAPEDYKVVDAHVHRVEFAYIYYNKRTFIFTNVAT